MTDDDLPPNEEQDGGADSAVDPQRIRKRSLTIRQRERASREFWITVFSTDIGRREMWNILAEAHTFEDRFACGPNGFPQPEATWHEAGKQSLGLQLYLSWLRLARDGVNLMLDENDPRFTASKKR